MTKNLVKKLVKKFRKKIGKNYIHKIKKNKNPFSKFPELFSKIGPKLYFVTIVSPNDELSKVYSSHLSTFVTLSIKHFLS